MRCLLTLGLVLLAGCPGPTTDKPDETPTDTDTGEAPLEPGTETVTASWDVDMFSAYGSPTLPAFDPLDGTRKLDSMTIFVEHTTVTTIDLENASAFPLAAADYSAEHFFQTIIQLGAVEDDDDSPPFFGPGAFLAVVAEDLATYDGDSTGGDDQHSETLTESFESEFLFEPADDAHFLEAMTGTEDIQLVVGGFSEMWVYWENDHGGEALLNAGASALRYSGTITVTYAYSAVEE